MASKSPTQKSRTTPSTQPRARRVETVGGATPARLRAQRPTQGVALIKLDDIKPRVSPPTRSLSAAHLVDLAASIAALDLLEPLVVDRHHRLLAGGHRLAALLLLAAPREARISTLFRVIDDAHERERIDDALCDRVLSLPAQITFDLTHVPVRVMAIDAAREQQRAFEIEASENEKRRDYTAAEVRQLLERLKALGYRTGSGRPKKHERPATPLLATVVGKSERQVWRLLKKAEVEANGDRPLPSKEERARHRLRVVAQAYLTKYGQHASDSVRDPLAALLEAL